MWAGPIESGHEPTKARQFAGLIGPFLLRRRKSDPGIAPELPDKTETDHLLGLTREQVVLYESFVRDTMARIERADEQTRRGLVLKLLTGLKQICNHPAHFLKQSGGRLTGRSEKLDLLDELLDTALAEGSSVLVFTQYVAMARLIEDHLSRIGVSHQFLHGGTPVRQREAMVASFQAGPDAGGVPVFLLSLKAGGTGLNLTRADHVIHVDRWWNPAVEDQATDRAHRIGQTRAGAGAPDDHAGHRRGTGRRAPAAQALPGRRGARPRRGCADRAEQRRAARSRGSAEAAMTAVTFARIPPRRSTTRAATWWGRAWVRAVEEAAYSEGDLHVARGLSRSGAIGGITVDRGSVVAACYDRAEVWSVGGTVPELDPISRRAFVDVVGGESGHLASLLSGELPYRLVEQAEEAGVELLPYGGELGSSCPCGAWVDPCVHALAVLLQVAWLVDGDPWVLLRLRGLTPEDLQAELAHHDETDDELAGDLAAAVDAAVRAARFVALADDPSAEITHLV